MGRGLADVESPAERWRCGGFAEPSCNLPGSLLQDAAELVREEGALFKRKARPVLARGAACRASRGSPPRLLVGVQVRQVVIQGGVLPFSPGVAAAPTSGSRLRPPAAPFP